MNYSILRTNPNSIATNSERQHASKMSQSKTKRPARSAIHPTHEESPFAYSHRSTANERHPRRNEDSILIDEMTGLFAVFDGVGGSAAAEIASQTAVQATMQTWRGMLRQYQRRRKGYTMLEDCETYDIASMLEQLVLEADEQV